MHEVFKFVHGFVSDFALRSGVAPLRCPLILRTANVIQRIVIHKRLEDFMLILTLIKKATMHHAL